MVRWQRRTRPDSSQITRSARAAVDTRWATISLVQGLSAVARARSTCRSVAVSRLEVASSRMISRPWPANARARPRRWYSPPESGVPASGVS
ncbi:hypothetical protein ACFQ60_05065 [Streptomyces zhihengii]